MNDINRALSSALPAGMPLRLQTMRAERPARELSVMRVRDFVTLMKLVAEHDLWDNLETQLTAQGCGNFRVSALPMQLIGGHIRQQVAVGTLPVEVLEQLASGSCLLCPASGGGAGDSDAGGTGDVPSLKPGTSVGDPQDGGVGSKKKPQ